MDIDSFAQCLSFIQATAATKPPVEKYLPVAGTLLGTGLGFGLNQYFSWRKDGKSKRAKKRCCEEDCHELMNICDHTLKSLVEFCVPLSKGGRPRDHHLLSSVNLPLLEEYYPEIAHGFSIDQRYWIKTIFRYLNDVNRGLELMFSHHDEKSLYQVSINLLNLSGVLVEVYKLSIFVLSDKKQNLADSDEFLRELDVSEEGIVAFDLLRKNADSDNTVLRLN